MTRAAIVAALVLGGGPQAGAGVPDPFTVTVHLQVERRIASRVNEREVREEAASLWRPYGVELEWAAQTPVECEGLEFEVDANIEKFPFAQWVAVLGQASLGGDPFHNRSVHVSFGATERLLIDRAADGPSAWVVSDRDLARALGRVLAHEIGHVLLAAPYHEHDGLMRANFAPRDLLYPDRAPFRLSNGSIWRLKTRVRVLRASM
jgi:hypothetical protein